MNRRRRRLREIPFSLDSFLDVVANVVGIIIRLILVAWVGARTYSSLTPEDRTAEPAAAQSAPPAIHDPLESELARHQRELQEAQKRLLDQLRQLPPLEKKQEETGRQLALLGVQRQALSDERAALGQALAGQKQAAQNLTPSLAQLREQERRIREEMAALEKAPAEKKVLHFRVPVSRPVHQDEIFFECKAGRVSFVDFPAFVADINDEIRTHEADIARDGRYEGVTRASGFFRVRFVLQRNRLSDSNRLEHTCEVEPLAAVRGESAQAALAPGSQFRHLLDGVDAKLTVATFWVYPDSFALFRQLRDYAYERGMEVACWPQQEGQPIRESSRGSKSRGQ
jgi:hypothetical protein